MFFLMVVWRSVRKHLERKVKEMDYDFVKVGESFRIHLEDGLYKVYENNIFYGGFRDKNDATDHAIKLLEFRCHG